MNKAIAIRFVLGVALLLGVTTTTFAAEKPAAPETLPAAAVEAPAALTPPACDLSTPAAAPAQQLPVFAATVMTQSLHSCESPGCANTPGQCSACTTNANCSAQCTEFGFGKCQGGKCVCVC